MGSTEDAYGPWMPPALEDLLPDLSREEQLRLQNRFRDRDGKLKRHTKNVPPLPPLSIPTEEERDSFIIPTVRHALHHYNARHPGGEFDAVKPLMKARVGFRGQVWSHVNFWARSRCSSKIKRFFAEVYYKPSTSSLACSVCTIIEEPLCQYRRSCAFCPGHFDILHPKGCRKFVCGNDKDRIEQRLKPCNSGIRLGLPFTCRPGPASRHSHSDQEKEEERREV